MAKTNAAKLTLEKGLSIVSAVDFNGGLLDLGNQAINLGSTGSLVNESESSRAYTTGTGYIQAQGLLNSPAAINLGNLGAVITSAANLGNTIIRRGHAAQTGMNSISGNSIHRYYDITPANNTTLKATLWFHYFDAERSGISESSLQLWKSINASWATLGYTTRDLVNNYVEKKSITSFSRMTLSDCPVMTASVPDVYAVNPGGAANTLYLGYGPASVTLSAQITGGTAPYTYTWLSGSPEGAIIGTGATLTVSPPATAIYYLKATDSYGCNNAVVSKTVSVMDIRCGTNKVTICVLQKGKYTTSCVATNSVSNYLANGSYLGSCNAGALIVEAKEQEVEEVIDVPLSVKVFPNPSASYFTLIVQGNDQRSINISITDALGRLIERRSNTSVNTTLQLGHGYKPGIYFLEVQQGKEKTTLKMIKGNR
ncbi:T9SS type A sorting domain-containing protein [Flavisolibacter sp. BT320]|nr:T9SS type A sorting domain-containing protein [Flavisolibacter longurius]